MPSPAPHSHHVPAFEIRIDGRLLPPVFSAAVGALTVDQDVRWPTMFAFDVCASDAHPAVGRWTQDERLFAVGSTVAISFLCGEPTEVVRGEITALAAEFDQHGLPRLTVRGFDRRHRLQRGRRTRSYVRCKDSDVFRQIAAQAGIQARAADSGSAVDFLMQVERSDWDFLCERAMAINWDILMDGEEMTFAPRAPKHLLPLPLDLGGALREFSASFASSAQATGATARGWDLNSNAPLRATARAAALADTSIPPTAAQSASRFGEVDEVIVLAPAIGLSDEAARTAQARIEQAGLGLVHGHATCAGNPALRAGASVDLRGVGPRFGGTHYIVAARHRHDEGGYVTDLQLRRSDA